MGIHEVRNPPTMAHHLRFGKEDGNVPHCPGMINVNMGKEDVVQPIYPKGVQGFNKCSCRHRRPRVHQKGDLPNIDPGRKKALVPRYGGECHKKKIVRYFVEGVLHRASQGLSVF